MRLDAYKVTSFCFIYDYRIKDINISSLIGLMDVFLVKLSLNRLAAFELVEKESSVT